MRRALTLGVFAAAAALAASGCGGSGGGGNKTTESSASGGTTTVGGEAANNHGVKDVSGESEVGVEMDDFYFAPTVLKGTPGQTVTLELENEGKVEHNLTIEDQGIDKDVDAGQKASVQVTIPDSGSIAFYCKYHRDQGMGGALATGSGASSGGSSGGTSTGTSTSTSSGY